MRYVSKIDGRESIKLFFDEYDNLPVTVHNTVNGKDTILNAFSLLDGITLGVGTLENCLAVVRHTIKTVTLHSHIVSVEQVYGPGASISTTADFAVVSGNSLYQWSNGTDGHKSISINVMYNAPEIIGHLGSVVHYIKRVTPSGDLCTLYDYLSYLCKATGKNLFSYRSIHLYSELCSISTIVKLSESAEAMRYFTKAYMDSQL